LLGSAEQAAAPSVRAEGDILMVAGARYRLSRRLGAGGMGEVFLARKLGTGGFERDVALKTVLPVLAGHQRASAFLKSFVDEARLAALLHHPNICQVYDLQPLEGRGLIQVLEYIPGHSLKAIIETARKKRAALTEPFVCFVASEVASALDYAHTATDSAGRPLGVVHRDVTPHNIMVADTGNVKLLDFGIAFSALDDRDATASNMVKGKDQYYAPEQLIGVPLDGRADQFALGLCLYEMLVLRRFFTKATAETDTTLHLRIAQLTPETVEGSLAGATIDPSLKQLLHHALAPSRDERFATCSDFGDALRAFTQRRGWLFTAADARKELEALFALPDAADAEKTNPSGKRVYSVAPRRIPKQTVPLPALTPGRTALTPPVTPVELEPSRGAAPARAPVAPALQVEDVADAWLREEPDASTPQPLVDTPEASVSLKPSQTAVRRRAQVQEALHNPKASARKMLALPLAVLAATLVVGVVLVKVLLLSSPDEKAAPTLEVVKTPEQLRAEREAEARAAAQAPPPELAPLPPPVSPPVEPSPQPAPVPVVPRAKRPTKDARAVDELLTKHYGGGRPVVTPDAPNGAVAPAVSGARRRSLDTVMIADMPATAAATEVALPKGATLAARLTSPADAAQPSPATAVITADFVVAGAVVVPKGSTVVCSTAPAAARLGLACDTLHVRGQPITIDAIALGRDKRVGFPLPRAAGSASAGDVARDNSVALGRNLLGRATPDGPAGDVAQAAADTVTTIARGGNSQAPPVPLVPAGTTFSLFLQSPAHQ
jgi:serine/threonine protein kinase